MKKLIFGVVAIFVVLVATLLIFNFGDQKNLSEETLKEIAISQVNVACNDPLETYSEQTPTCPYCREITVTSYSEKKGINYVEGNVRIAWGGYNNRPGTNYFNLSVDSEGEVVSFSIDKLGCVY